MISPFEHPGINLLLAYYPWAPQNTSILMGFDSINPMRSNSQVSVNQQVQFWNVMCIMGMGTVGPKILKLPCQSYKFFSVLTFQINMHLKYCPAMCTFEGDNSCVHTNVSFPTPIRGGGFKPWKIALLNWRLNMDVNVSRLKFFYFFLVPNSVLKLAFSNKCGLHMCHHSPKISEWYHDSGISIKKIDL